MNRYLLIVLTALLLPAAGFAQANKPAPTTTAPAAAPGKPAETAKPADPAKPDKDLAKSARPLPMNARVDEIDAAAKTFTQNTREGKKVKHIITTKTEIKQGSSAAKFEDIKVGDMVAGSRLKKNPEGTEYEVVKITKFSAKAKPEEKK